MHSDSPCHCHTKYLYQYPLYSNYWTQGSGNRGNLESVSWSARMIEIGNLGMSIVEREPSGFRIAVKRPTTTVC